MTHTECSMQIEGMHCGACVSRVDKALRGVPGVTDAAVNLTTGLARVTGSAEERELVSAVEQAGYKARVLGTMSAATMREVAERGEVRQHAAGRRLWVGVMLGLPVLLIDLFGHELVKSHEGVRGMAVVQLVLSTVVMGYTGWPFFAGAWRALRHRTGNMDVLVALGSGVAFVYSVAVVLLALAGRISWHGYHLEFHAALAIVVLVALGKYLEAQARKRAASAVAGLATQAAATAIVVLPEGGVKTIPAEQVVVGQHVQVLAHQVAPVDGEVMEGAGSADMSVITGESVPVEISTGSRIPGGATLADGRVVMRATSTAGTSTVARILELVNAAQASKTQIQGLADRVAAIFVPIVLVLGAVNFAGWMLAGASMEEALITTIATIVIACPCAMGLATPTAITVAMGRAAKLGILFTKARALEMARTIGTVVFDKTGTLTEGKLEVTEVTGDEMTLHLAASIEQFSDHPLAKAIVARAAEDGVKLLKPVSYSSSPGGGVRGVFLDGREVAAGSAAYLASLGIGVDLTNLSALVERGLSVILAADVKAKKVLGMIGLADSLRAETPATLKTLRERGLRIGVLSGDTEAAVKGALGDVQVDFIRAGVSPPEKAAAIESFQSQDAVRTSVAFVGDGINDGLALAAADLGIAMAGGSDIAKAAGDVLLMNNRLAAIPAVLQLSRQTLRVIRQNLFWAFAYNVAAIPLAMGGVLSPGIAAGAMMISSLTVVLNALRLYRVKL